jgi:hypothetical protein
MAKVDFGIFDWIDRANAPLHQLYEQRLQLLEVADGAEFFCYHLAEHHATPLGMAPSPALFLSAAAQRTQRIRLGCGTLVAMELLVLTFTRKSNSIALRAARSTSLHWRSPLTDKELPAHWWQSPFHTPSTEAV